jgi:hypothetical protein
MCHWTKYYSSDSAFTENKELSSSQLDVQLLSYYLLGNNWSQVFNSYNALKKRDEKSKRQLCHCSVAGSFFKQLLLINSLDFSFSASAFQLLDIIDVAFVRNIRDIKATKLSKYKSSDMPLLDRNQRIYCTLR